MEQSELYEIKKVRKSDEDINDDVFLNSFKWLQYFAAMHNMFREVAIKKEAMYNNVFMILSTRKTQHSKGLRLDLWQNGKIIAEGPVLSLTNKYSKLFEYLLARVLDFYMVQNYKGNKINFAKFKPGFPSWMFYSSQELEHKPVTIMANLNDICKDDPEIQSLVLSLAACHNEYAILTADFFINEFGNKVKNIDGAILNNSINATVANYNKLVKNGLNLFENNQDNKSLNQKRR